MCKLNYFVQYPRVPSKSNKFFKCNDYSSSLNEAYSQAFTNSLAGSLSTTMRATSVRLFSGENPLKMPTEDQLSDDDFIDVFNDDYITGCVGMCELVCACVVRGEFIPVCLHCTTGSIFFKLIQFLVQNRGLHEWDYLPEYGEQCGMGFVQPTSPAPVLWTPHYGGLPGWHRVRMDQPNRLRNILEHHAWF